ncbi:MAG: glycosyltransferase family 2 protein [Cyanobacteriota bacterium]|jgi:hypothetical protein
MNQAPKPNLNFYLYQGLHGASHKIKRRVPNSLIKPNKNLSKEFQIGITTYIDRYEAYFKPLYFALKSIFPDVQLTIAVNGFTAQDDQQNYLKKLQNELCNSAPANHRFYLHDTPHGLTKLWNEILSESPDIPTFILNDDLRVYPWLRRWAESLAWKNQHLTLINSTWSHFIISPEVIQKVGAFDPGFPGIGFEDMDYTARASLSGCSIGNILCPYIRHQNHQPQRTSFDDQSDRVWGKYTSANQAFFFGKWRQCSAEEGVYIKQLGEYVCPVAPLSFLPLTLTDQDRSKTVYYPDRN